MSFVTPVHSPVSSPSRRVPPNAPLRGRSALNFDDKPTFQISFENEGSSLGKRVKENLFVQDAQNLVSELHAKRARCDDLEAILEEERHGRKADLETILALKKENAQLKSENTSLSIKASVAVLDRNCLKFQLENRVIGLEGTLKRTIRKAETVLLTTVDNVMDVCAAPHWQWLRDPLMSCAVEELNRQIGGACTFRLTVDDWEKCYDMAMEEAGKLRENYDDAMAEAVMLAASPIKRRFMEEESLAGERSISTLDDDDEETFDDF